ncbi:hypothetical protein [Metabacillus sp. SLBN-84]
MVDADSRLIDWLFHESGISRYKISKDLGIAESTLSRIANGHTPIEAVRFGLAHQLTEYARSKKTPEKGTNNQETTEPKGGDTT